MEPAPRTDPEALLAHAGWMRALAQSLLQDPAAADDVVQEATVAAWLHAPADDAGLEPWLSRVVRNFAWRRRRGEARRAEREAQATQPAAEPSPADTVERLDLQRTLVEAVRAIDEPLRTTLVLRYFEGRSSAEIARLQRVPAGTVRWRLKRGLDELRERLDARLGSRENWVALIVPFAARPMVVPMEGGPPGSVATGGGSAVTSSKILTGVLAMKAAQLAAIAVALVIMGGFAWWSFDGVREQPALGVTAVLPHATTSHTIGEADPATTGARERVVDANTTRASVTAQSTRTPEPETRAAPANERIATVDARFLDEHGTPWSDVHLVPREVDWLPTWKPGQGVLSGPDGRAVLRIVLPAERAVHSESGDVQVELAASRTGCSTCRRSATLRAGETVHLGDVILGPGVRILGRAVDENGGGVGMATIGVAPVELSDDPGYMRRHGSKAFSPIPGTLSAGDGTFTLEGIAPGTLRLWAHAEGKRFMWTAPIEVPSGHDLFGLEIVLTPLLPTDRIAGRILGPSDEPIGAADLTFFEHSKLNGISTATRVDAEGRFELLIRHDDSTYDFTAHDREERFAATTIEGVRPGTLDVVIRMHEKRWLALHVRDGEGGPVADAQFDVEARGFEQPERATSPKTGDYSIALPDGKFRLTVTARGFRSRSMRSLDSATVPAVLDVVLQHAPVVRGRVLAAGVPIAGVRVNLLHDSPDAMGTVEGYRFRYMVSHGRGGTLSDAEGRFRLDCDEDHGFWLRATADAAETPGANGGWAPGEVGPLDAAQLGVENEIDIELTKGGAIEGHVLLPDGKDGEGTVIAINHFDGSPRTLRAGPKGFFHVDGLAPGKWQVLPAQKEIDPGMTSYASIKTHSPIEWSCEVSAGRTTRYDLDLSKP